MRLMVLILLLAAITACGGGGGGGSSGATPQPAPDPTDPGPEPTMLAVIDAVPTGSTNTDPLQRHASFAHFGHSDLVVTLSGNCANFSGTTLRRQLFDLSGDEYDEILDHRVSCDLGENAT